MKILFVHTFDYYEPIGIMTLSSFLKQHGHNCELLDLKFEKDYISSVKKIKPDILAFSITTNNWKRYQQVNLEIKKEYRVFSIFGGAHCTFFPDFINEAGVDAICRGEGEFALLELADSLEKGKEINNISNLWIKKGEQIFKNDVRNLIEDLDILPFPDRELVNKYNHYKKRSRVRTIASRGCPYQCTYCSNHSYKSFYCDKGKFFRQRSPENVIDEVKLLKEIYRPRNIEFHDDIFILNKNWTGKFLSLYIEEKINIPFEINVRADLVTPDIVSSLKKAGCYSVQFGVESGNEILRNTVLKRNISEEELINISRLLSKHKIKSNTYNLLGIPGETIENAFETVMLNSKIKPTYAMNTIYQPYPATELAEYAKTKGFYSGEISNFDKTYLYGKSVIVSRDIKRIERLHYLFSFGVKMPFLSAFIKVLINIPFNKLYQAMYFIYRAYIVIFIFKRLSLKEFFIREHF